MSVVRNEIETDMEMKFVKLDSPQHKCDRCDKKLHLVYYGCGGDCTDCPACNFSNYDEDESEDVWDDEDARHCPNCGIIFKTGATHASNGCTEDTYHALFPLKFNYDGETYVNQVPIIKKHEDYGKLSNIVWGYYDKTIQRYDCPRAFYPQTPEPIQQ